MIAWGTTRVQWSDLSLLTDEHADFSREFSSSFPLRGLIHLAPMEQVLGQLVGSLPRVMEN
jgi:hypothetical protein